MLVDTSYAVFNGFEASRFEYIALDNDQKRVGCLNNSPNGHDGDSDPVWFYYTLAGYLRTAYKDQTKPLPYEIEVDDGFPLELIWASCLAPNVGVAPLDPNEFIALVSFVDRLLPCYGIDCHLGSNLEFLAIRAVVAGSLASVSPDAVCPEYHLYDSLFNRDRLVSHIGGPPLFSWDRGRFGGFVIYAQNYGAGVTTNYFWSERFTVDAVAQEDGHLVDKLNLGNTFVGLRRYRYLGELLSRIIPYNIPTSYAETLLALANATKKTVSDLFIQGYPIVSCLAEFPGGWFGGSKEGDHVNHDIPNFVVGPSCVDGVAKPELLKRASLVLVDMINFAQFAQYIDWLPFGSNVILDIDMGPADSLGHVLEEHDSFTDSIRRCLFHFKRVGFSHVPIWYTKPTTNFQMRVILGEKIDPVESVLTPPIHRPAELTEDGAINFDVVFNNNESADHLAETFVGLVDMAAWVLAKADHALMKKIRPKTHNYWKCPKPNYRVGALVSENRPISVTPYCFNLVDYVNQSLLKRIFEQRPSNHGEFKALLCAFLRRYNYEGPKEIARLGPQGVWTCKVQVRSLKIESCEYTGTKKKAIGLAYDSVLKNLRNGVRYGRSYRYVPFEEALFDKLIIGFSTIPEITDHLHHRGFAVHDDFVERFVACGYPLVVGNYQGQYTIGMDTRPDANILSSKPDSVSEQFAEAIRAYVAEPRTIDQIMGLLVDKFGLDLSVEQSARIRLAVLLHMHLHGYVIDLKNDEFFWSVAHVKPMVIDFSSIQAVMTRCTDVDMNEASAALRRVNGDIEAAVLELKLN